MRFRGVYPPSRCELAMDAQVSLALLTTLAENPEREAAYHVDRAQPSGCLRGDC